MFCELKKASVRVLHAAHTMDGLYDSCKLALGGSVVRSACTFASSTLLLLLWGSAIARAQEGWPVPCPGYSSA
jgi:hypothetical protein